MPYDIGNTGERICSERAAAHDGNDIWEFGENISSIVWLSQPKFENVVDGQCIYDEWKHKKTHINKVPYVETGKGARRSFIRPG